MGAAETVWCIAHGCPISPSGCVTRQRNARAGGGSGGYWRSGAYDLACKDCEQGRLVAAGERARALGAAPRKDKIEDKAKSKGAEMKGLTKVCTDKNCQHGGEPQPLAAFSLSAKTASGRMNICKDCQRRRIMDGQKRAKAQDAAMPALPTPDTHARPVGTEPSAPADERADALVIDFSGHRDLLERLAEIAAEEMRTPEMQVLYWVRQHGGRHQGGMATSSIGR